MKKQKINFSSKKLKSYLLTGSISGIVIGSSLFYYSRKTTTELSDLPIEEETLFFDENHQVCKYFDAFEHQLKVSRNDAIYGTFEEKEGYVIKEVTVHAWKDTVTATYENTTPVIVKGTWKNDHYSFSSFGTVSKEKNLTKKLK